MNDEAVTNYQSIIDQMTWGLRLVKHIYLQVVKRLHNVQKKSIYCECQMAQCGLKGTIRSTVH